MTDPAFGRLGLELVAEDLVPLPQLPENEGRGRALAGLLRELLTQPGGNLEARAGAVLLDDAGQPRGLTAPFGAEWPRVEVQAVELFATAKKAGWTRLVLFRADPNPHTELEVRVYQFALELRAVGLLLGVEVEDLVILRPRGYWTLSGLPLLSASLGCEATLNRTLSYLIASGFGRMLPASELEPHGEGVRLPQGGCLVQGPWGSQQWEAQ